VFYCDAADNSSRLKSVVNLIATRGATKISVCDVVDFTLSRRIELACIESNISLDWLASPGFINTTEENRAEKNDGTWLIFTNGSA